MKRWIEESLLKWKNQKTRSPLILKGARQVGKSYSITHFGQAHFPTLHSFNFEKDPNLGKIFEKDLDPKRILNELSLHQRREIHPSSDLVFFDEIQECPKALTSLKYFQEEKKELALISAGSLLGLHLSNESFPVGKVDFLTLHPLNFEEFLLAHGEEKILEEVQKVPQNKSFPKVLHDSIWDHLKTYFIVGGLPGVVSSYIQTKDESLITRFQEVRKKQENLITAYLADMAKHSGKINSMHIERLWKNIPHQLAQAQDGSSKKFVFKGVIPGQKRYSQLVSIIDWLEAAGLILKLPIANQALIPLATYTKESQFKLFVFDVGLLGALSGLSPEALWEYRYGTYKGFFAENFVIQEFFSLDLFKLFTWKEKTAEVEFIFEHKGDIIPVEVKSGKSTKSKSLSVFIEKYQPTQSFTLSGKPLETLSESKIKLPLYLTSIIKDFTRKAL